MGDGLLSAAASAMWAKVPECTGWNRQRRTWGRIGDWVGMAGIFGKSRSFPLISGHLSRALGWDVGENGGGECGFGGDIHGFGGLVSGLAERRLELEIGRVWGWIRAVGQLHGGRTVRW